MKIDQLLEANEIKPTMCACSHCNGKGFEFTGLEPGFVRIENSKAPEFKFRLTFTDYYCEKIKDTDNGFAWYEIVPKSQPSVA